MAITSMLALEVPVAGSFDDPRLEWRRLFSEFVRTFLLVRVGADGAVVDAASGGQTGRAAGGAAFASEPEDTPPVPVTRGAEPDPVRR